MSKTAKEQLKDWDDLLDEYENKLGLPKYNELALDEAELSEYLHMNRDMLENLTPSQCGEISYRLSQFAFHIQRSINRENARINWAEETIKEVISGEVNNYKGYGYLEKSTQAIANNTKAHALSRIKKYAKQRSDRLSFLANSVKNLSDILISIQRNKYLNTNG